MFRSTVRALFPTSTWRQFVRGFAAPAIPLSNIRNIAIIAHVDHGKTTLVDGLLKQSDTGIRSDLENRVMDSNPIEKERGITILSKVCSVMYKSPKGLFHVNIADTPGHADFGGEVERIMSMVDGCALIVDATEGPMTQTKFVLKKALNRGLRPIVVFNKVDRESARLGEVENEVLDLFDELGANDEQLDFPMVYASGRDGWATLDPKVRGTDLKPLFQLIVDHVPPPPGDVNAPFKMLVTQIYNDHYLGKCLLGRIHSGRISNGDLFRVLDSKGNIAEECRILKLMTQVGLDKVAVDSAGCGQIVSIAGSKKGTVNSTLCDPSVTEVIPHIPIDPPTVCMSLGPNDGPMVGKEGNSATVAMIRDFIQKEVETNVSLRVTYEKPPGRFQEACQVYGRGELQLGILLENMRRAGFELCVGAPTVVMKEGPNKEILEPLEELVLECALAFQGRVLDKLAERKADLIDMVTLGNRVKMTWHVTTRGLIGYRQEFLSDTEGTGVFNHLFHSYVPFKGDIERAQDKKGAMIALSEGITTAFAIDALQSRGTFYIGAGVPVYAGMVVGLSCKAGDVEVNPAKMKQLSNVRNTGSETKAVLIPPIIRTLETMIADVRDDELIEITTKSLRVRKKELDAAERAKSKLSKRQRMKLLSALD